MYYMVNATTVTCGISPNFQGQLQSAPGMILAQLWGDHGYRPEIWRSPFVAVPAGHSPLQADSALGMDTYTQAAQALCLC